MNIFVRVTKWSGVAVLALFSSLVFSSAAFAAAESGYVGDAVAGLGSSPIYVDSDATLTDSAAIAAGLNGSDVNVVAFPSVSISTYSPTDLAGMIRQETGKDTVVVVVDNAGRDQVGVSSESNATEIATVVNEAMTSTNGDAGAALASTVEQVASLSADATVASEGDIFGPTNLIFVVLVGLLGAAAAVVVFNAIKRGLRNRNQTALPAGVNLIAVESGLSDEQRLIENSITTLQQQLRARQSDFPEKISTSVNGILATLQELLPQWKQMDSYADQKFTINRIITDYLPNMLNTYLELPKSYLARTKKDTEGKIMDQLRILQDAVNEIQDSVYEGVEQKIEEQGHFLATRFQTDNTLRLK